MSTDTPSLHDQFLENNPQLAEEIAAVQGINDLAELGQRFNQCLTGCHAAIAARYSELLPGYLTEVNDLIELESWYFQCPTEYDKAMIVAHYTEIVRRADDLDELEKRYENCPEECTPAIAARYSELLPGYLTEVNDLGELVQRYKDCPRGCEPAIAARYSELLPGYLAEVNDLDELQDWYEGRPTDLQALILQALAA